MKKLLFVFSLFCSVLGWGQQEKLSPYTLQFLNRADSISELSGMPGMNARVCPDDGVVSVFIRLADAQAVDMLSDKGVQVGTVAGKFVTAQVRTDKLREVAAMECVEYLEMGTPVYSRMDEVKKVTNTDKLHLGTDLPHVYCGKDVVLGFIDNGFDYGHLNFRSADKQDLRIKRVWNQNQLGVPPQGFGYGAEYTTQESILKAQRDSTLSTHGTHVAGIAAGAAQADGFDYNGIAPEADIVLVSLNTRDMFKGNNAAVIDGINYIYNYAESVGKPCVINLSLGSHLGPHDGTSTFDQMADELQGPGKLLVGSVGNEATNKFHVTKSFSAEKQDTLKTFIKFRYKYDEHGTLEIWGDAGMEFDFIPFIYSISDNRTVMYEPVSLSDAMKSEKQYQFTQKEDNLVGKLKVNGEVNPNNGKPHMVVSANFFRSDSHRIGFCLTTDQQGTIHLWTENYTSDFSNFGLPGFVDGNDDCSMGEIGGTGKRIISVGGYVTRDHFYRNGIYYPSGEELNNIISFSSHGPTVDGRVKPEVTAPGSYVVSSVSSWFEGNVVTAASLEFEGKKHKFGYMQGTSMSSPVVAGILSTWLQVNPNLTPEDAKQIIKQTAIRDSFTGEISEAGSNVWGYGKIDAWKGLKECIRLTGVSDMEQKNTPVVVLTGMQEVRLLFTGDWQHVSASLFDTSGTELRRLNLKNVQSGSDYLLDVHDGQPGIYLLHVECDKETLDCKVLL